MTFTALVGAVSHFGIGGLPDTTAMITCIFSTLVSAQLAALIANKVKPKTLNITVGVVLLILGIVMLVCTRSSENAFKTRRLRVLFCLF